jgi:hypothetical protein
MRPQPERSNTQSYAALWRELSSSHDAGDGVDEELETLEGIAVSHPAREQRTRTTQH